MVALTRSPPPGVTLCDELPDHDDRRLKQFTVSIKGADETLYAGEEFKLFFKFPDRYPFDPPEVGETRASFLPGFCCLFLKKQNKQ